MPTAPASAPQPRTSPPPLLRSDEGLPALPNTRLPAGDHQKLAVVRFSIIGAMAVLLPPALVAMDYAPLAGPVFLGALVLLIATAIGYYRGRQTGDLHSAWLFYAGADTLVILA